MKESEKELRDLVINAFKDIKIDTPEKYSNTITLVDNHLNVLYVKKEKQGLYVIDDGRKIGKDKHGFFVIVDTNEILNPIESLSEEELFKVATVKINSAIKSTEETCEHLRKTLDELSTRSND